MSTISKLDLTQDQIKTIDQLVKKDIAGNNFVDANLIKSKANLNDQQVNEVVKAMNNYNQLPTELKDGTINSVQATTATTTLKNVEKDEATPLEKVISFVSEFGNVKGQAYCDYNAWADSYYWWGIRFRGAACYAQNLRNSMLILALGSSLSNGMITAACILAGSITGIGGFLCYGISTFIMMKAWNMFSIGDAWMNTANRCGGWAYEEVYWHMAHKNSYC